MLSQSESEHFQSSRELSMSEVLGPTSISHYIETEYIANVSFKDVEFQKLTIWIQ